MTLREHLEAIRDRHKAVEDWGGGFCAVCDENWPCADYSDAVAALAILDDAERLVWRRRRGSPRA